MKKAEQALQTLEHARRQADEGAREAIRAASRFIELATTLDENIRRLTADAQSFSEQVQAPN